jgi:hypothetical protein
MFSNRLLPNRHHLFSDKGPPNGIAYSAIKERQITIAYLAIKEHQFTIAHLVIK